MSQPGIAIVGFALLAAFALGLVWRAGDRWVEALDAAGREIAARVEAEQELAETARLLATLVSSSPVATPMAACSRSRRAASQAKATTALGSSWR